jgi:hypothetical protein
VIVSDDPTSAIWRTRRRLRAPSCSRIAVSHVVGAAHAGWRGTVQDAAGAAVRGDGTRVRMRIRAI